MDFYTILPFICLVLVFIILSILLTKNNKWGHKKRAAEDERRHEHASDFALKTLPNEYRDEIAGVYELDVDLDNINTSDIWFLTPLTLELLSSKNNILIYQFFEDGTCQLGVLNKPKNIFYGTFNMPLNNLIELDHMKSTLGFKAQGYLCAPYQAYEVEKIDDVYSITILEDDDEDNEWTMYQAPYTLENDILSIPVYELVEGGYYTIPFKKIDVDMSEIKKY